jgi:hypothetical protein
VEEVMAVLCEAISLVVRAKPLMAAFRSSDAFKCVVPNETLAADNELIRVGFMTPEDSRAFAEQLETRGLRYVVDGAARDMVIIDQISGPAIRCDWVEFGHVSINGHRIAAARLVGSTFHKLFTPEGWQFEGSLTQSFVFVPTGAVSKSLRFLRSENGLDIYLNLLTGKEVYVGRTSRS